MDAKKTRFGADELDAVFDGATKIVAGKGKKSVEFAPKRDDFDRAAFEKAVLGPSGNLRAPAARIGKTWLVGFNDEAWSAALL